MKNIFTLFISLLLLAACSTPKYSYHFDHYDYNSGKRKADAEKAVVAQAPAQENEVNASAEASPLTVQKDAVVASSEGATTPSASPTLTDKLALKQKYAAMSKSEKKEFRKAVKSEIKKYVKAKKSKDGVASVADAKAMDHNLKMAIIFGAVALTLSFFGGVNSVFWIVSVICLVIGVVFFIKWIAEQ